MAALLRKTQFVQAVEEAVAIEREWAKIATPRYPGTNRDAKLEREAYLDEALRNARTTVAKLRKTHALLAQTTEHPAVDAFVAAVYKAVLDATVSRPPMGGLQNLLPHGPDLTAVLIEGLQHGANAQELIALAVWRVTEEHPDTFGWVTDWDAHDAHLAELRARHAALTAAIPGAAREDRDAVHYEWIDPGAGLARATYRWRGKDTGVSVGAPATLVAFVAQAASQ
jgi:hypothetical protein